ncbi:MAG: hypothetical protein WEB37_08030 [Bacteroidota bacterium]
MNRASAKSKRILAIDPTSRGFGFAVLEGPERLIDWGVVQVRGDRHRRCLARVDDLLEVYRPDIAIIEDLSRNRRRPTRVKKLLEAIRHLAAEKRIVSRRVSKAQVQRTFAKFGGTIKHEIAAAVAKRFPELSPRLPPRRKLWMSEAETMAVFDAVAFASTFFKIGEN